MLIFAESCLQSEIKTISGWRTPVEWYHICGSIWDTYWWNATISSYLTVTCGKLPYAPAQIYVPQLLNFASHISGATELISIQFSGLVAKVFKFSSCEFNWNWIKPRLPCHPLCLACLFGNAVYYNEVFPTHDTEVVDSVTQSKQLIFFSPIGIIGLPEKPDEICFT